MNPLVLIGSPAADGGYDVDVDDLQDLHAIIERLQQLQSASVAAYEPLVDQLIAARCRDTAVLEQMIDRLGDVAGSRPGARLYRRFCQYVATVDLNLAAQAAASYREIWDPDEEKPWR